MVYSNATALCAAFGLPTTPNYAKKLDDITTRTLNLYNPDNVPRIAEELERTNAPWLANLQKRMGVRHPNSAPCPTAAATCMESYASSVRSSWCDANRAIEHSQSGEQGRYCSLGQAQAAVAYTCICLLYTSDVADE